MRPVLLLLLCLAGPVSAADDLVASGRSIYETGLRIDGSAVPGRVQADVELPPPAAACSNCHRRSGYGISEGGSRSLNVTARALFAPSTVPPERPAYDDGTLVRSIVSGIAANGRELHANMPRYELSAGDAAALVAYLRTLGSESVEGITSTTLTLATIVADSAPAGERDAVEGVLSRYVEQHNAQTRKDAARAEASARHAWGRTRQRAYRNWDLRVWRLRGEPRTWRAQLEEYYATGPPFAVLTGLTGSDGSVVHSFCEQRQLPCLLPITDLPVAEEQDFYSLYFSAGLRLEADVLARHLRSTMMTTQRRVLIVHVGDQAARASVAEIRRSEDWGDVQIDELILRASDTGAARSYRALRGLDPEILVLLQSADAVAELLDNWPAGDPLPSRVYTADSWTDWQGAAVIPSQLPLYHVYPYSLPAAGQQQFPREFLWLRQNDLLGVDRITAVKALFACRAFGMGMADIQNNFSREYFLEILEHALDGTQLTSLYPRTSIGPDQRLLSRGAYVVQVSADVPTRFSSPLWIQP